jgi:hypothetical protein
MISETRCPTRIKQRLAVLESLAAGGLLEDFSPEEDELFELRSQSKLGGDSDDQ